MSRLAALPTTQARPETALSPAGRTAMQRGRAGIETNEPLEREADRLADQVMAAPGQVAVGASVTPPPHPADRPAGRTAAVSAGSDHAGTDTGAGPGEPLAASLRVDMEHRFDHDFSRVRVHTDGAAARQARALGALAFAQGSDIVFGAGAFQPQSRTGRRLLAHELAHVVQQSRPGEHCRPMLQPAAPAAPTPADPLAAARQTLTSLRQQTTTFARTPPADLAVTLQQLRTSVNDALRVATADPTQAALVADLRTAYTDAVRAALTASSTASPGAITTPPTVQELYERHRNDIEPFALPAATTEATAQELSAELDAPLPPRASADQRRRHTALATARRQLRVITSQVTLGLESLFSTVGATTTIPLPTHATVRFASGVPAALQRGLRNVAGSILNTPLTANTTVMLALDLRAFGGGYDAYRFTHLDLGTTAAPQIEILVELQGAIGVEGLLTQQRADLQARFTRLGFQRGSGFSDTEFDQVLIGVGEVPEARLSPLGAVNFARAAASATDPNAAAEYDQTTHTVTVYDRAYASGMTRFGRGGRVLKFAAHSVVHELGHALDLSSLRTTAAATSTAEAGLLAEFGTGGGGYTIPDPRDPSRARYDTLNTAVTRARTAEQNARSLSGARWQRPAGGGNATVVDTLAAGAAAPAFRAAAARDDGPGSPRMPTTYPNPTSVFQEYYAESFALYQTSPDLLRRIRPNVFAYFAAAFPP